MIQTPKPSDIEKQLHAAAQDALERHRMLRELLRLSGADPEIPFPPARMRTKMTVEPRRVRFVFPIVGYGLGDVAMMVAAVAAMVGVGSVVRWAGYGEGLTDEWWLTAGVALAVALGFRAWVFATRQVAVTISREELEWVRQGSLRCRRETVRRDEIARLVLPPPPKNPVRADPPTLMKFPLRPFRESPGIILRSTERSVEFGRNLSYVELRWIHIVAGRLLGIESE